MRSTEHVGLGWGVGHRVGVGVEGSQRFVLAKALVHRHGSSFVLVYVNKNREYPAMFGSFARNVGIGFL